MEQLSEFDERFIRNYNENNDKGYILTVDVEYPKNLFNLQFYLKERRLKNTRNLFVKYITRKTILYT